ncbi:MAG: hypothetical protein ABSF77_18755, partial [Spirochaetia bacterium]
RPGLPGDNEATKRGGNEGKAADGSIGDRPSDSAALALGALLWLKHSSRWRPQERVEVVLPIKIYEQFLEELEDHEDIQDAQIARQEKKWETLAEVKQHLGI